MPRRSAENSTVVTGNSSLRNLEYEPSVQGSVDDGTVYSDGQSAMSSVLSSVKRNLRSKGTLSTQSCSTRQSEGIIIMPSESDEEIYSTESDEEIYQTSTDEEQDEPFNNRNKSPAQAQDVPSALRPSASGKTKIHDTESIESTEESTAGSETLGDVNVKIQNGSSSASRTSSKPSKAPSQPSKRSSKAKKPKETTSSRKGEPVKRLRFSTEALGLAAQSRINETRHTPRFMLTATPQCFKFGKLEYVNYDAHDLEVATNNQDISTLHPLGKEETIEVFKNRVPFVVPVSQSSSDEMSSIHAMSTKVPVAPPISKPAGEVQSQHDEKAWQDENRDVEEGVEAITIPYKRIEETSSPTQAAVATSAAQGWPPRCVADRSNGEIFFATLIGVSLVTLIVLLALLFAT